MERMNPEQLEKMVHAALRALPDRHAPATLEARVRAAIEARAAIPWWHKSYAYWPKPVRIGFLLACVALVAGIVDASLLLPAGVDLTGHGGVLAPVLAWGAKLAAAGRGIVDFVSMVFRNLPAIWVYGALAFFVGCYAMLFGLGAAAYRTIWMRR